MPDPDYDFAWRLLVELRKELTGAQQIRAQVIGFKITFVSAAIGLIVANLERVPNQVLVIPAFAAIFFDSLINSYSFSIKRIGFYCRHYLEPTFRRSVSWPASSPLWEEFMKLPDVRQYYSVIGDLGITGVAVISAGVALFLPFRLWISLPLLLLMVFFFLWDIRAFLRVGQVFSKQR